MASTSEYVPENDSGSSEGTPGTPGSDISDGQADYFFLTQILGPEMCKEFRSRHNSRLQGMDWVEEILNGDDQRFYDQVRMTKPTFTALCSELTGRGVLTYGKSARISVYEEVMLFMRTVGMHHRHRDSMERFQHSSETINRHIRRVLQALVNMAPYVISPLSFDEISPQILHNPQLHPYFKDCVGALDGSANDARVLMNAINTDLSFPFPPPGKYYLVDAGYTNYGCFLAPYRQERYHITEFRGQSRRATHKKELFNHRHSKLRNAIERSFGILKKRFPIISWGMPSYLIRRQTQFVIACCVLHNFIRKHSRDDEIFNMTDAQLEDEHDVTQRYSNPTLEEIQMQSVFRDNIANWMWSDMVMAPRRRATAIPGPPDQWDTEVEERLMNIMIDTNTEEPFTDDWPALMELPDWTTKLEKFFRRPYSIDSVKMKYYELRERHGIFSRMKAHPLVKHDHITNTMTVPYSIRGELTINIPGAWRYFVTGEKRWDLLKEAFRDPNAPIDEYEYIDVDEDISASDARHGDNEIVIISDFEESTHFPRSQDIRRAQDPSLLQQNSYTGSITASNSVNNYHIGQNLDERVHRRRGPSGSSNTGESSTAWSRNRR